MGKLLVAFAAGYVVGRMAKGDTASQAVTGGVGTARGLVEQGIGLIGGQVRITEPSFKDDRGVYSNTSTMKY